MKIIKYKSINNDEPMIAFKFDISEVMSWSGFGICDWCNELSDTHYFIPELGLKTSCEKCFKDYQKRAKWYYEDTDAVCNIILMFFLNYYKLDDKQIEEVQEFFNEHKRGKFSVKDILKQGGM